MQVSKTIKANGKDIEYFIITDGMENGKTFKGSILIAEYENFYTIKQDENPVFSGFVDCNGDNGEMTAELNKINFNEIIYNFYKDDWDFE